MSSTPSSAKAPMGPVQPARRLANRVMDFLFGKEAELPVVSQQAVQNEPVEKRRDTAAGTTTELMNKWRMVFYDLSTKRRDVYADVVEMDETVEEVAAALDILADNVVNAEGGTQRSFWVDFAGTNTPQAVQDEINNFIDRVQWHELAHPIARSIVHLGDCFIQIVINNDLDIVRFMEMPAKTMFRNEDNTGVLLNLPDQGLYAFEQRVAGAEPIPFFPWQIEHLRWDRQWGEAYGRSLLFTARTAWRKLQAMEEALVINWLTRAFARLLFILDITDKSPDEADTYIESFKHKLLTKSISSGVEGSEELSVVKDIFIGRGYHSVGGNLEPGLADVKVLDTTSTGFWNLNAIEYYRGKILTALRVPKAHLGLEKDINAKSTLQLQDKRFGRTIRRVQSVLSESLDHTIKLQLVLHGYDVANVKYVIRWPQPSWADEVDLSAALKNYADADATLIQNKIITPEYAALNHLEMTPAAWQAMQADIQKQAKEMMQEQERLAKAAASPVPARAKPKTEAK